MQEPQAEVATVDPGNHFLGPDYPGQLISATIQTPGGPRVLLTIRCGPATVTVTMDKDSAKLWARRIDETADATSGLIVPNVVLGNGRAGG